MNLLSIIPLRYRVPFTIIFFLSTFTLGFMFGLKSEYDRESKVNTQHQIKQLIIKDKQNNINEKVIIKYVDRIKKIESKSKESEINQAKRINQIDNDKCIINDDFSLLWNEHNSDAIP